MTTTEPTFWSVLLWTFWFFLWVTAIIIWFRCALDVFSDRTLNGWAKAGWAVVLILLPWLGALVYLIVRGWSMSERQLGALAERQGAQQRYVTQVAAHSASAPDQIVQARQLLDSGAISQAEFDTLKAKVLT